MTETSIRFTSEIVVEVIQQCGTDEVLAHAAWVSTRGVMDDLSKPTDPTKVRGVLNYLMERRHGTPFEHGFLSVRVHAPIKVWREWHRHRIGQSYNEESGRYKDLEPVFYLPPRGRPMIRPDGFKSARPSFDTATDEEFTTTLEDLRAGYEHAYVLYRRMLDRDVDRGLARDVLGVGIYSACWVSANPRSIMAFLELRTDHPEAKRPSSPLYEIRVAADKLEGIFARYWPITHEVWVKNGRMAP